MPHTIQPQEHSRGSGIRMYLAHSDGDPNLLSANRNDGSWLNTYNGNSDNEWNRDNGFAFLRPQLSSFPRQSGGVLFTKLLGKLPIPTTELSTHFIKLF